MNAPQAVGEDSHFRELFFLGFLATAIWPSLLAGVAWAFWKFHPNAWKLEGPFFLCLFTVGFHQWLFVLPGAWFMKSRGWRGSFWGLLCGAGLLLLANLLLIAFVFFFIPHFD